MQILLNLMHAYLNVRFYHLWQSVIFQKSWIVSVKIAASNCARDTQPKVSERVSGARAEMRLIVDCNALNPLSYQFFITYNLHKSYLLCQLSRRALFPRLSCSKSNANLYTRLLCSCAHSGCCVRMRFACPPAPPRHSEAFSGPSIETKTISCVPSISARYELCVYAKGWLIISGKEEMNFSFPQLNLPFYSLICIRNQSFYRQQHVNAFPFFGKRQTTQNYNIIYRHHNRRWIQLMIAPSKIGASKRKSVISSFVSFPFAFSISRFAAIFRLGKILISLRIFRVCFLDEQHFYVLLPMTP